MNKDQNKLNNLITSAASESDSSESEVDENSGLMDIHIGESHSAARMNENENVDRSARKRLHKQNADSPRTSYGVRFHFSRPLFFKWP